MAREPDNDLPGSSITLVPKQVAQTMRDNPKTMRGHMGAR